MYVYHYLSIPFTIIECYAFGNVAFKFHVTYDTSVCCISKLCWQNDVHEKLKSELPTKEERSELKLPHPSFTNIAAL